MMLEKELRERYELILAVAVEKTRFFEGTVTRLGGADMDGRHAFRRLKRSVKTSITNLKILIRDNRLNG